MDDIKASMGPVQLHAVLVTYRRPLLLDALLGQLSAQDPQLASLVVVDNDPDPANAAAVHEYARTGSPAVYCPAAENLGPAGGIELGMREVLQRATDHDWVVLLDDDNRDLTPTGLADLLRVAIECLASDQRTAGVGERGGHFSWLRARGRRGAAGAEVDYLAGNGFPMYRIAAIRDVGLFAGELFFGFDDLEYGLRLREAGYTLHKADISASMPTRLPPKRPQGLKLISADAADWRRYYSLRNLIVILRTHHHSVIAARVSITRGILKPLVSLPIAPRTATRHLALNWRAIRDAWWGRSGRRVEPPSDGHDSPVALSR